MDKLFKDIREAEEVLVNDYADMLKVLDYLDDEEAKPSKHMANIANCIQNFCCTIVHKYLLKNNEDTGKAD